MDPRRAEELANALTHGAGLVLSLIGVPVLIVTAVARGDAWQVVGCSVFGATLVALYATSTIYHAVPGEVARRRLQVLDHVAIYLLIAGTYTPFTLGVLRGAWGWTLFGIVWTLAALGIVFKLVLGMRHPRVSVAGYVLMGWIAIVAAKPMAEALPLAGMAWVVAGGLLYTAGVGFFLWERLRFAHAVWHLFVLAGSICHFWAVLAYALPAMG